MQEDHRGPLVLVLGGARSGKSRHAEALIERGTPPFLYAATAQALDGEMEARIALHRSRRDDRWITHDCPLNLAALIAELPQEAPVLVDCLTLWLTNHLLADHDLAAEQERLVAALGRRAGLTVLVANEVGLGIVPDNALARRFRDAAGRLNQQVAARADHVVFMVAGLPMTVKGQMP
ncbi:bifunctional adenosylcobinamide kinase/adenosylcobinamide-phosphate guanylyltransferase [Aquabacter cavernae]|uniref:bifunctional adenosylcobinamide kinase/adenosylcobinamide-phosphate guanylyltransferase n=1 Tax=Aquabacter cavernae TaxID=2496029 RepID=UPI000F8E05E3|nr:bifunctional adenosylcobinamide kinase/adenosylcobinamide-phosphate guanylyltransferase [Aquabacter cavernae]